MICEHEQKFYNSIFITHNRKPVQGKTTSPEGYALSEHKTEACQIQS